MSIRLSTKSRTFFFKIYRERKQTYMCSTKTARPLSHIVSQLNSGYTVSKSAFQYNVYMYLYILYTLQSPLNVPHYGPPLWTPIMEIRSTRSFNAIPATLIRGVFNLYLNLLIKYIVNTLFIYLFFYLFIYLFYFFIYLLFPFFNHCNFLFICVKYILTYLLNVFQNGPNILIMANL